MQKRMKFSEFDWINYNLKNKVIRFTNCFVLDGEELVSDCLWIRDGTIVDGLSLFFTHKLTADIDIDAGGAVITPGFIDIQVNGAYGYDFSNPEADSCELCLNVARKLPLTGVTSFCPTIITSDKQTYIQIISRFGQYVDQPDCAHMLGLHLEGPFISKLRSGMHPKERILEFGPDPVKTLLDTYGKNLDIIRIVTIAPEIDGSSDAITELVSCGVVVSIGHTDAGCKTLERAVTSGATLLTHLFNAMPMFHHRSSHLLGGITKALSLHVGLIADLVHVSPAALRLADALAPKRIILVTDANTAFGLGDGSYTFGEQNIEVVKKVAYVTGTNCIAGGTTALSMCVCNFWLEVCQHNTQRSERANWPGLGQALAAASTRPARVLGLYRRSVASGLPTLVKGTLEPGADADLTILCPDSLNHSIKPNIRILSTWISGRPVFTDPTVCFTVTVH